MRSINHKKSVVAGIILMVTLLGMFPVVSSVSCNPISESISEAAEGVIYGNTLLSPIPIITRPEEGCWYFLDVQVLSGMPFILIVGSITMNVKVIDPTGYGVNRVDFFIDDELKATIDDFTVDDEGVYWCQWVCGDELPQGEHEIVVWAWDDLDNYQSSMPITVKKGLMSLSLVEYSVYLEVSETLEAAGVQHVGVSAEMTDVTTYYSLNVNEMGNEAN